MSCRLVALCTVALLITRTVTAAEKDAEGFVALFNGRDLSGWVGVNVAPSTFTVKDGLIYCTGVPTGVMRTERMYENFIVECEWRHLKPAGNAGFFVWSDAITSKGVPFTRSVEVQVLDEAYGGAEKNKPRGERRFTTHGDVFPIHGATMIPDNPHKSARPGASGRSYPTEDRSKPAPEWNHYRIECRDGNITLAVNGKVVTSGKDASPRKGYICLESEGGQVEWRNLRIKELPASGNLEEKHVAEADRGFKSLYNGLDLEGWKATEGAGWRAQDWTLRYEPKEGAREATLWSATSLSDFELIVDVNSAGPVELIVRGRRIEVPPLGEKGGWRRVGVSAAGGTVSANVDGKEAAVGPMAAAIRASDQSILGLSPKAAAEFANVYVRPAGK